MTIIAWDGETLAADKRVVNSSMARTTTKIKRIGDVLVGVSGNACHIGELFKWVENGCIDADYPKFQNSNDYSLMLMIRDRKILLFEQSHLPFEIENKFTAIGSGRDYAIAAMHLGKSAVESVEIASLFDVYCGNGVDYLNFNSDVL